MTYAKTSYLQHLSNAGWPKKQGDGGFNIAIIDLSLLETISNEVWDVVHTENKREVSLSFLLSPYSHVILIMHLAPFPPPSRPSLLPLIMLHTQSLCHTGMLHTALATPGHCATPGCYTWLLLHPVIVPHQDATHGSCYTCTLYAHLRACFTMGLSCHTPTSSHFFFPNGSSAHCVILIKYTMSTTLSPRVILSLVPTLYIHAPCTLAYLTDAIHL